MRREENEGLRRLRGIAYRHGDKIKVTEPRPFIRDLDSMPFPARHLVPFESYRLFGSQIGDMITSGGCPFSCTYCSSSLLIGKKFRVRSPGNVVDEMEELIYKYKYKVK